MKFHEQVEQMTKRGERRTKRREVSKTRNTEKSVQSAVRKVFPNFLKESKKKIRKAAKTGQHSTEVCKDNFDIVVNDALTEKLVERLGDSFQIQKRFVEAGEGYWSWSIHW